MSTLSEREGREGKHAQAEIISAFTQAKQKQDELVLGNMKRLRNHSTNYAITNHEPDRLNT